SGELQLVLRVGRASLPRLDLRVEEIANRLQHQSRSMLAHRLGAPFWRSIASRRRRCEASSSSLARGTASGGRAAAGRRGTAPTTVIGRSLSSESWLCPPVIAR